MSEKMRVLYLAESLEVPQTAEIDMARGSGVFQELLLGLPEAGALESWAKLSEEFKRAYARIPGSRCLRVAFAASTNLRQVYRELTVDGPAVIYAADRSKHGRAVSLSDEEIVTLRAEIARWHRVTAS